MKLLHKEFGQSPIIVLAALMASALCVASCASTAERPVADAGSTQKLRELENQLASALARTDLGALSKL